ncbi:hypothetical protein EBO15_16685 [Actinomadura harenae]|uniref:Uncharacterized protein n=1 Tax=Actinomadura harenae TaxID=2483351 RepID=A0A3M2M1B1_9ACTN|nr:hypothetical protein EBO15_16685 [Actinomadura harenae]
MRPAVGPGTWTHLTGAYDGIAHTTKPYVNGTLQATACRTKRAPSPAGHGSGR